MPNSISRQRAFIEHYIQTGSVAEAAHLSGYKVNENSPEMEELKSHPWFVPRQRKKIVYTCVYIIREEHGLIKIGKAADFEIRFRYLGRIIPYNLEIIAVFETEHASSLENELHKKFSHRNVTGEWFALNEEDIKELLECLS